MYIFATNFATNINNNISFTEYSNKFSTHNAGSRHFASVSSTHTEDHPRIDAEGTLDKHKSYRTGPSSQPSHPWSQDLREAFPNKPGTGVLSLYSFDVINFFDSISKEQKGSLSEDYNNEIVNYLYSNKLDTACLRLEEMLRKGIRVNITPLRKLARECIQENNEIQIRVQIWNLLHRIVKKNPSLVRIVRDLNLMLEVCRSLEQYATMQAILALSGLIKNTAIKGGQAGKYEIDAAYNRIIKESEMTELNKVDEQNSGAPCPIVAALTYHCLSRPGFKRVKIDNSSQKGKVYFKKLKKLIWPFFTRGLKFDLKLIQHEDYIIINKL